MIKLFLASIAAVILAAQTVTTSTEPSMINEFVAVALSAAIPVLVGFTLHYLRQGVHALFAFAEARVSEEDRARLYGAIKIGLQIAEKNGYRPDAVAQKFVHYGVNAASNYLKEFGLNVSPELLRELIEAEYQKQSKSKNVDTSTWLNPNGA